MAFGQGLPYRSGLEAWMICLARCCVRRKTMRKDEIDGMIKKGRVSLNESRYEMGVDDSWLLRKR